MAERTGGFGCRGERSSCSDSERSRVPFESFRLSRGLPGADLWKVGASLQLGLPIFLSFEEVSPRSSRIVMEPAIGNSWFSCRSRNRTVPMWLAEQRRGKS